MDLSGSAQSIKASKVEQLRKYVVLFLKPQRLKYASRTHIFVWFCSKSLKQRPDACLSLSLSQNLAQK